MKITIAQPAAFSAIGTRKNNEDALFPLPESEQFASNPLSTGARNPLFVVCDGVGGAEKGEEASRIVAQRFYEFTRKNEEALLKKLKKEDRSPQEALETFLNRTLAAVEKHMDEKVAQNPAWRGMASTLTYLMLSEEGALVGWAGDSRIYHFRQDGTLAHATEDHSWVNAMVKNGDLTPEEAKHHPRRNMILRAVSGAENPTQVEAQVWTGLQPGDWLLLCSDGVLETFQEDEQIGETLRKSDSPQAAAQTIKSRCEGVSNDNNTLYVIRIEEIEEEFAQAAGASAAGAPSSGEFELSTAAKEESGANSTAGNRQTAQPEPAPPQRPAAHQQPAPPQAENVDEEEPADTPTVIQEGFAATHQPPPRQEAPEQRPHVPPPASHAPATEQAAAPQPASSRQTPWTAILIGALVLLLGIWAAAYFLGKQDAAPKEKAPPARTEETAPPAGDAPEMASVPETDDQAAGDQEQEAAAVSSDQAPDAGPSAGNWPDAPYDGGPITVESPEGATLYSDPDVGSPKAQDEPLAKGEKLAADRRTIQKYEVSIGQDEQRTAEAYWYHVTHNGVEGWVFGYYTDKKSE